MKQVTLLMIPVSRKDSRPWQLAGMGFAQVFASRATVAAAIRYFHTLHPFAALPLLPCTASFMDWEI